MSVPNSYCYILIGMTRPYVVTGTAKEDRACAMIVDIAFSDSGQSSIQIFVGNYAVPSQ